MRELNGSGPVIAVDGDILLRQIAGENAVAPAPQPERHLDRNFPLPHDRGDGRLVIVGVTLPLARDPDAAEPDRKPVAIRRFSSLADGHHAPSPVRVFSRDRRPYP